MKRNLFNNDQFVKSILTYVVDAIFRQPVERLEKQKNSEECNKLWIEVISKHGKCEAGFGERIPETLHQVLKFGSP